MVAAVRLQQRIEGGFVRVEVASLLHAWRATGGDLRTRAWLACHLMVAARQGADRRSYGYAELAALLSVSERSARLAIRRLERAGLIEVERRPGRGLDVTLLEVRDGPEGEGAVAVQEPVCDDNEDREDPGGRQ